MADIAIFRINYKSDFILTLNSDAGWATPFCIKFWTGAPSQAFFAGWDGTTYTHCAPVEGEPTKLMVQFDDHHLPIGNLKFQIGYHFTVADFPTSVEDEVINQASVIIEVDDAPAQVMLDLNGETAPEIEFSLPAYANEAQRIENEQTRIANEETRVANEEQRVENEQARVGEYADLKADAVAATDAANDAAALANQKAQLAQQKAGLADDAATLATQKAGLADDAATLAAQKAGLANDAAALATQKAGLADDAATLATQKAGLANDAATLANQKAQYASDQGDYAKAQGDYAKAQAGVIPVDVTRTQTDAAFVNANHDPLFYLRQANSALAGLMTAAGYTKLNDMPAAQEVNAGLAYDVSVLHPTSGVSGGSTYASLSAALAVIPNDKRKGGMTVKFVLSSDNIYVQFRLMHPLDNASTAAADFAKTANWQGVDAEPTAESQNLVTSGGVSKVVYGSIAKFPSNGAQYAANIPEGTIIRDFTEGVSSITLREVYGGTTTVVNRSDLPYTTLADIHYINAYSNPSKTIIVYSDSILTPLELELDSFQSQLATNTENLEDLNNKIFVGKIGSFKSTGALVALDLDAGTVITDFSDSVTQILLQETRTSEGIIVTRQLLPYTLTVAIHYISAYTNPAVTVNVYGKFLEYNVEEIRKDVADLGNKCFVGLLGTILTHGANVALDISKGTIITNFGDAVNYIGLRETTSSQLITVNRTDLPYKVGVDIHYVSAYTSPTTRIGIYGVSLDYRITALETTAEQRKINIILPDKVYTVVGEVFQLFHRSCVQAVEPYNYNIVVSCSIGVNYPRYFEVTPSTAGSYPIAYYVYDNNGNLLGQKTTTLIVKPILSEPASKKNVLMVGDSIYANGYIVGELSRRLKGTGGTPAGLALTNIDFIGRKNVNGVSFEATGGYSWSTYATNAFKDLRFYVSNVTQLYLGDTYTIESVSSSNTYYLTIKEINIGGVDPDNILCEVYGGYIFPSGTIPEPGTLSIKSGNGDSSITYSSCTTEPGNPFWNENKAGGAGLDFINYSTQYCNGEDIDILAIHIGTNGITTIGNVDTTIENYVKPFVRAFHTDYPSSKMFIGGILAQCISGIKYANVTYQRYNLLKVYLYYLEKIQELANDSEFSSYLLVADTMGEFDSEHGYPLADKPVFYRSSITEPICTNAQHPSMDGDYTIADIWYEAITYILS